MVAYWYDNKGGTIVASLKDVSRLAGVTASTVSRYLSGELNVKKDTETRILQAIKELDYRPNHIARALKLRKTKTIGVIVPSSTNPLFAEIVAGIYSILSENHYAYIQMSSENNIERELGCFLLLQEKQVDGLIVIGSAAAEDQYESWLAEEKLLKIPTVFINRMYDKPHYTAVRADFEDGAYQAVSYLIQTGRRRIAMISGIPGLEESVVKERGYFRGLQEHGITPDKNLICPGYYRYDAGYLAAQRLLEEQQPDAVFAVNDLSAIAALSYANVKHLRIPEDLAVIGYGNSEASAFTYPALSTIDQQKMLSGQRGAALLLQMIEGQEVISETIETKLILRSSC